MCISLPHYRAGEQFGEHYVIEGSCGEGRAQGAIRPTRPLDVDMLRNSIENGEIDVYINMTKYHYIIYDLIFTRFIQSQMKPGSVIKYTEKIKIPEINKEI
jgi:Reverse gyrase